ncbi:hypothetical protein SLS55_008801 [Diplodia seriata]|uniref:NFACT RNA-binding domain-containing protein n=1 Tax=Diplodia seriata TaxID=420778 RepID=A0ABR3C710_9PEZI
MVYYFTSNAVSPAAFIYVGKDKVENEELIKFGWEEDVCAHIYVRLREGETWDNIAEELLKDCAQLTKANSIEGNKKNNITVIYTPWSNLKKDGSMAVGQVGFKDNKKVKRIHVVERENPIVNRLNKTKVEKFPDLRQEREDRQSELRKKDRASQQERVSLCFLNLQTCLARSRLTPDKHLTNTLPPVQKKEEARIAKERKELAWQRDHAYDDVHADDQVAQSSNQDRDEDFLDDFM